MGNAKRLGRPPGAPSDPLRRCAAFTAKGSRCLNDTAQGGDLCGSHGYMLDTAVLRQRATLSERHALLNEPPCDAIICPVHGCPEQECPKWCPRTRAAPSEVSPATLTLLGVLATVRWPNSVGKGADAVNAWQAAGSPDAAIPCPTCGQRSHAAAVAAQGAREGGK